MTIEEYKELMLFYLLDVNTSDYKYATVDEDGELFLFRGEPTNIIYENFWWDGHDSNPFFAASMPLHEQWRTAMIKL